MAAAVAVALALTTAACGSDSGGSSGGGSAGGGEGGPSAEQLAELEELVAAAQEVPVYEDPGPPLDLSSLAGKKVMIIPVASQLPVCDQIGKDIAELAEEVGMTGTYFENSGGPPGWIPGMQQAISQDYDAIIHVCAWDPELIRPQMEEATEAGIAVISSGLGDTEDGGQHPLVTAQTNIPTGESMRRSVDVAILEHEGEPFDSILITSDEIPLSVKMEESLRDEFETYCPACNLTKINIAVPDWATRVQPEVNSALLANPTVDSVILMFDGMVPPGAAAIAASGREAFIYGAYGGTPEYVAEMGESIPMRSDTGPTHLWRAYATADQMFRVLTTGEGIDPNDAYDPHRLWTLDNKDEVTGENDGFGTDFVTGYRTLWGLE